MSAYAEALRRLFSSRRLGIDLGLDRVATCFEALQLPAAAHSVQIAGTNGKGSTANFIAAALLAQGISVGVFSSPHLNSICQRFVISGHVVGRTDFVRAYAAIEQVDAGLTFFEQVTLIAAWLFADAAVEVAIYEVGLGGRLDSTTALPADIGVVTGIGLDHCEFLGDSLMEIAREKAGIFRPECPAIVGLSADESVRQLLTSQANRAGSLPRLVGREHLALVPEKLAMSGEHQRENAASAVAVLQVLIERGLLIDEQESTRAIANAQLPGRMQRVRDNVWVDGAHNAQAARSVARAIADFGPITLVLGMSAGKDIREFLIPFRDCCAHIIATQAASDRAARASDIANIAKLLGFSMVSTEPTLNAALSLAQEGSQNQGQILVTGSLFVVGDTLQALLGVDGDPIVVSEAALVAEVVPEEYS